MIGKKAQALDMNTAPRIILTIVLIGMILGAGVIALAAFRDTSQVSETGITFNFTAINETAVSFARSDVVDNSCAGTVIVNSTGATVTGSFTISGCEATLGADITQNNTNHQATYTATVNQDATTVMNNTIEGSVNVSDQLPTVGTLVGVGLILAVVIGVFAFMVVGRVL